MTTKPLIAITGASSGIGAAMAKRFSDAGHPLLLLARRVEKLEALNLTNTLCRAVDVTNPDVLQSAIREAEEIYGPVDLMVNNAGVMLLGQIDTQDPVEWKKMFDVNVIGLLHGVQSVLSDMKARKGGTILNISSIAGRKSFPNHAAYVGTKFAVSAMSENIREEVADDNVRVMTICPGVVGTELIDHTTDEQIKSDYADWRESIGGALEPDDIARTAEFMYGQPQGMNIREVVVGPTRQPA
ncbi:putative oxidoreductase [Phaeobacter italicus]|jgi:NADP-dependent 3-hydroxy acid dehydrogenase YdfG|uniref:Putative oxidoreductase n=1 Tax=Phaeobacter italicus TaxID=481446 RepID=A0A0H5CZA3_9RHOB|nr:SDR family oxidoreductase [Phaeobacter italicus]CRL09863.1 putative oxidoreductase [Phaeobacter italicus]